MLKRPLISEKSMSLTKLGLYTFVVSKDTTKKQVEKIVKDKFNVDILSVKMIQLPRKIKSQRTKRGYFEIRGLKKAVVKLKKDQKIALFESISTDKEEVKVTTVEGEQVATVKEKKSLLRGTKVKIETSSKKESDKKGDK